MTEAVNCLDPDGTDAELRRMVVVGHSQGGLLTRMTSVDSGDVFWNGLSKRPFDPSKFDAEDREMVEGVVFVKPLPFVSRVIFICTPHRGSFVAASDWIRSIVTRIISLPAKVTRVTASLITLNPELGRVANINTVNAVDNMAPTNRFIKALSALPIDPNVTANSIIAVEGEGPLETLNDGVVEYSSAHIDGVESEKVVHSPHSAQGKPATIEEVRRILLLHSDQQTAENQLGKTDPTAPVRPAAAKP